MVGPARVGTIGNATGETFLGSGVGSRVSSLLVQFDYSAAPAANHSISLKGRAQGDGSGIFMPLVGVAYKNMTLGDVVSTAITADALVLVDASGLDIVADVTTVTTGSVRYTVHQLVG